MPEGPSIVILKEEILAFKGKKIIAASGSSKKIDFTALTGKKIQDIRTWGKNLLLCLPKTTIRIHLMMFGSYRLNERKEQIPRLQLQFANGAEVNFYSCVAELLMSPCDNLYDWSGDIMNPAWDGKKAIAKLKDRPTMLVCDALLDQQIFAGCGNIIKNEVLFRTKIHPQSKLGKIPSSKLALLVRETVNYSFDFLKWKKEFSLKKHWLAYAQKVCPRDHVPFKKAHLGETNRRTFYCPLCEKRYS